MKTRRVVGVGRLGGPISRFCWRRWITIGFVLLLALAVLAGAKQARASTLPSNCTASGATVTCTFSAGPEGTFTVPDGVSDIDVVAVGAGGGGTLGGSGGPGAQVTADLGVTAGSTLFAEVAVGGGAGGGGRSRRRRRGRQRNSHPQRRAHRQGEELQHYLQGHIRHGNHYPEVHPHHRLTTGFRTSATADTARSQPGPSPGWLGAGVGVRGLLRSDRRRSPAT
jgi:hypothetical protein